MFYQGDIQSGINAAVHQSKFVVCFVRDDGEESTVWENDFLDDATLRPLFLEKTVLLQLQAGSQEAGFLAAIYPIPKTPTLVIIHVHGILIAMFMFNSQLYPCHEFTGELWGFLHFFLYGKIYTGPLSYQQLFESLFSYVEHVIIVESSSGQLKEYLTTGISKSDFLQRVRLALDDRRETSTMVSAESTSATALAHENYQSVASTSSQSDMPSDEGEQPHSIREIFADRSARHEIKKKEQDAAEKAERAAKAKARKEALENAATDPQASNKAADMKYALMQKKRQEDARNERARILKLVEDDKTERRVREALRKEQGKAAMGPAGLQSSTAEKAASSNPQRSLKDLGGDYALQVRLFDGTTIRSRFSPQSTLRKDVRQWIDGQQADGKIPYTFKQVLIPQPNRTITISEEDESLQSLGLSPSATFILVPLKNYASAYEGGPRSYIYGGISAGITLVSSGVNVVTGAVSRLLGSSKGPGMEVEPESRFYQTSAAANVKTSREQEGNSAEHQLYNGNTLNFEPRREDDGNEN